MGNSIKDSRDKVSLEELLRFKKAERPDQTFWDKFDSELHQRMMQTLVKKDPWFVQLMRGLSGKFVQTSAIAAAAAVMAVMVIRPAFLASSEQSFPVVASVNVESAEVVEMASTDAEPVLIAEADYEIEMLSAATVEVSDLVTSDYGLDHLDVASYDSAAYSSGMSLSGFTSTGLASLVY